jgi:peptide/nickel transport system permease protein
MTLPLDPPRDISAAPEGGEGRATGSIWRLIFDVFIKNRLAVVGLGIIVFFALFSFVGPLFYHTDQIHTNISKLNLRPSSGHPLGTDNLGYDVLGRLMLGGQSSLEVGLAAALLASLVGTAWGAVSGFVGGWIDAIMMRVVDSLLAIPYLIFVLLLASIFTPSIPMLILVIAMVSWLFTARLVRGDTLSLRIRDYVLAAKAAGTRSWRIVMRHIIPNVMGTVVVSATFSVADSILLLAALSYLGLGPPPPAANWGGMLTNGLTYVYDGDWWLIYPAGIAIVLVVVAFNFIGDALRDSLEVRLQER